MPCLSSLKVRSGGDCQSAYCGRGCSYRDWCPGVSLMRIRACNLAGSLALLAVLTAQSQSASTGQPDARHIAQLIDQLGSKKFQERELAARELDVAGPAALEPLQKATHHQ